MQEIKTLYKLAKRLDSGSDNIKSLMVMTHVMS